MGYQVTITRTDENADDGLISKEEWLAFVASSPELTIKDDSENFPSVVWKRDGEDIVFFWEDGGVWSHTLEEYTFLKMIEIASKLEAKVIGEDGTVFTAGENGDLIEKHTEYAPPDVIADKKPWWKKLLG